MDGVPTIQNSVIALDRMLDRLTRKGKSVLISVDEVTSTPEIRKFTSQFQIFMRKNYRVFLLMTGLYENIDELMNEKTQTFLYRAPRFNLQPLDLGLIASSYQSAFELPRDEAIRMASVTKGYSYAYQALGYYSWKLNKPYQDVLPLMDAALRGNVYQKIWSEISNGDKKVLIGMASTDSPKVAAIRETISMNSSLFSTYRKRLIKKQLVASPVYGELVFSLPRFREFVQLEIAAEI